VKKKKESHPPKGPKSKILATLQPEADDPDDEDTAGETTTAGRARGAKNYSTGELKLLIDCVRETGPIGPQGYGEVAALYNRIAKERHWAHRNEKPLRQRWDKVQ
jgi:hypothetical protein